MHINLTDVYEDYAKIKRLAPKMILPGCEYGVTEHWVYPYEE